MPLELSPAPVDLHAQVAHKLATVIAEGARAGWLCRALLALDFGPPCDFLQKRVQLDLTYDAECLWECIQAGVVNGDALLAFWAPNLGIACFFGRGTFQALETVGVEAGEGLGIVVLLLAASASGLFLQAVHINWHLRGSSHRLLAVSG